MARGPRLQRRHRRQGLERRGGATGQTAPRHGRKNRKTWKLRGKVGGSRGEPCPVGAEQRTGSINASRGVQRHLADRRSEQIGQGSGRVQRSEERRVGKGGVSTCRSRWSTEHYTKNHNILLIVSTTLRIIT